MAQKFNYIEHYKTDAEIFDYFENKTGATEDDERRVHEYLLSKIDNKVKAILDVGSGSAWVAKNLSKSGSNIISLDISKINVKTAKEIVPDENHSPVVADSFYLPFSPGTFDLVIASEIIEHVIDPNNFIIEMLRVVKNNGKVIITTPYKEKLRYYLCVHCNKKTPVHAHINSFDENKLISFAPGNYHWETFGNKLLIFLRTYILLRFFPFKLWRIVDKVFNIIYKNPVHIIFEYFK